MRPQKRSRGRNGGGNPFHNGQNRGGGGGGGGGPRPPHRSQTFDSNGPSVKIRGNAYQVFERYLALAREAQSSGDRIAAENFYQHAEHYFRVMNANGEAFRQQQQQQQQMQPDGEAVDGEGEQPEEAHFVQIQPAPPPPQPPAVDEDQLPPFITGRVD
ncbi:MAG TPA: DUF4167 domain-containing protein [Stellaceae bacterium]|jgi:hypothetical protein|nr:DUF4167 domain-containing protein [Stellaceae bacterium]